MKYNLLLLLCSVLFLACGQEKELTTVQEIIDRHLQEVGGDKLGKSIKTLRLVSQIIYEDQSNVTITSRYDFPTKLHQNELYAGYTQDYILNGELGVSIKDNMLLKTLEPHHVANLKEDAHLMAFYRWEERNWEYKYIGKQAIDNQQHYVLEGKNESLGVFNRIFMDTQSFLIQRFDIKTATFSASSDFKNYFEKDGLRYPGETVIHYGTYFVTSKVTEFTVNPILDNAIFEIKSAVE
jgi:hypothetical protein